MEERKLDRKDFNIIIATYSVAILFTAILGTMASLIK